VDPKSSLLICIYLLNIQDQRWYEVVEIESNGVLTMKPDGDVCWGCGKTFEVWPRTPRPELVQRVLEDKDGFGTKFFSIKRKIEEVAIAEFARAVVESGRRCDFEVYIDVGFVPNDVFTAKLMPAKDLQAKSGSIPNPFGGDDEIAGVYVPLHNLPPDVPRFVVRRKVTDFRSWTKEVLGADNVLTKTHARDMYFASTDKRAKSIDLKLAAIHGLDSWEMLEAKKKDVQRELERGANDRAEQLSAANEEDAAARRGEVVVRRRIGGRLEDDDEDEDNTDPKKNKIGKGRGKTAKGGKGGGKASGGTSGGARGVRRVAGVASTNASSRSSRRSGTGGGGGGGGGDDPDSDPGPLAACEIGEEGEEDLQFATKDYIDQLTGAFQYGRECNGLRKRVAKMTDSSEKDALDFSLSVMDAARETQEAAIMTLEFPRLRINMDKFDLAGIDLPFGHKLNWTRRVLSDELARREYVVFVKGMAFFEAEGEATTNLLWHSDHPSFITLFELAKQEKNEQKELPMSAKVAATWLKTFCCDAWHKMFAIACEANGNVMPMVTLSRQFLELLCTTTSHRMEELPAEIRCAVDSMIKLSRGILATCSHIPHLGGSSIHDVRYLVPDSKVSAITTDLPNVGKIILGKVKQADGSKDVWQTRKDLYMAHAGAEAKFCESHQKMSEQISALLVVSDHHVALKALPEGEHAEDHDHAMSVASATLEAQLDGTVTCFLDGADDWAKLRPNASVEMETTLLKVFQREWDSVLKVIAGCADFSAESVNLDMLGRMSKALGKFTIPSSKGLMSTISSKCLVWQQEDNASRLRAALVEVVNAPIAPMMDWNHIRSMLKALKAASPRPLSNKDLPAFAAAVIKLMSLPELADGFIMSEGAHDLAALWAYLLKDPRLLQLSGTHPQVQAQLGSWSDFLNKASRLQDLQGQVDGILQHKASGGTIETEAANNLVALTEQYVIAYRAASAAAGHHVDKPHLCSEYECPVLEAQRGLGKFLQECLLPQLSPGMKAACSEALVMLQAGLDGPLHTLKQISGGGPHGSRWTEGANGKDVLEHFKVTLDLVQHSQISTARTQVESVLRFCGSSLLSIIVFTFNLIHM
jgi:hypothetical protein